MSALTYETYYVSKNRIVGNLLPSVLFRKDCEILTAPVNIVLLSTVEVVKFQRAFEIKNLLFDSAILLSRFTLRIAKQPECATRRFLSRLWKRYRLFMLSKETLLADLQTRRYIDMN